MLVVLRGWEVVRTRVGDLMEGEGNDKAQRQIEKKGGNVRRDGRKRKEEKERLEVRIKLSPPRRKLRSLSNSVRNPLNAF